MSSPLLGPSPAIRLVELHWRSRDHPQVTRRDRRDRRRWRDPHAGAGAAEPQDPAGRDDRGARRGGGEADPQPRRDPVVQGLQGLQGLDLLVSQPHGGPRDPGPLQAQARGHPLRRRRRDQGRLGRRRRHHLRGRRDRPDLGAAARRHARVAAQGRRAVLAGQPPGRHRPRRPAPRRGGGFLRHPLARRPRHRTLDARGSRRSPTTATRARASSSRRAWCSPSSR